MNSLGDLRSGSRLSLFSEMESGAIERGVQVGPELCTDSCRLVELLEVTNKSFVTASEKSVGKKKRKWNYGGRMASGLMGGGEVTRGGVARNWTEMELRDLGKVFVPSVPANPTVVGTGGIGCNGCSSLPSTRIGIMRSRGVADSDVTLTGILISAFWIGFGSLTASATAAAEGNSPGPFEKRFNVVVMAGGWSRVGLRMPRIKAFSDPAMQSSSVLSLGNSADT